MYGYGKVVAKDVEKIYQLVKRLDEVRGEDAVFMDGYLI